MVQYDVVFFQPCLLTSGQFAGEFGICCKAGVNILKETNMRFLVKKHFFCPTFNKSGPLGPQDAYPRVCPALRRPPPPGQCLPRPLGQPADHECGAPGTRDTCVGADSLCCFNGCLNVCLPGVYKLLCKCLLKL